jgi:hypothetical protein
LRYDLHSLASGAHHDDESTVDFVWTREDAEASVSMVVALLARVTRKR